MPEAERERFGAVVRDLSRVWRRTLNQRLKPLGLSQTQWRVILQLSESPEGMIQHDLAERLAIEAPSLVRLLDRMVSAGWVERRESPTDRRCKLVYLTDKARSTARKIETTLRDVREELLADVTVQDLEHCERVFQLIARRAEAI